MHTLLTDTSNISLNELRTRHLTDLDLCSGCRMMMPSSSTSVVQSLSMLFSTLAAVTASMLFFPSHQLFNTPSQPARSQRLINQRGFLSSSSEQTSSFPPAFPKPPHSGCCVSGYVHRSVLSDTTVCCSSWPIKPALQYPQPTHMINPFTARISLENDPPPPPKKKEVQNLKPLSLFFRTGM